jgi:hypothetical protein
MRRIFALSLLFAAGCNQAQAPAPTGARPAAPVPAPPPVALAPVRPKEEPPTPQPPPAADKVEGPLLAYVLLGSGGTPDVQKILAAAGPTLSLSSTEQGGSVLAFEVKGGGGLFVARVPARHPDAAAAPRGPFSPRVEEVEAHVEHLVVKAMGLPGNAHAQDAVFVRLVAAVVQGVPAVAVTAGPGVVWLRPDAVLSMTSETPVGEVPYELTVNLSLGPESEGRLSLLSHGMVRYGREEFYLTGSRAQMPDALDLVLALIRWLATSDHQLPTGETVGRSAEEKLEVKRQPHPVAIDQMVIRLDL